jgi:predicted permease
MRYEIRHAIRALLRDRAFSVTVVLSLAVGIGANTAIFSLVNGILLQPPAYRAPERLVAVDNVLPKFAKLYPALPVNIAMLNEWRSQAKSFESLGALRSDSVNLTGVGEPELLPAARVSANLFAVLGAQPRLGRGFIESEDRAGSDRVAILSDALWRRRFHSDPGVVGRKILLNGTPHEVAGVLPPGFELPAIPGFLASTGGGKLPEILRPWGYEPRELKLSLNGLNFWVFGRLAPGVTAAAARAEMNVVQAGVSARLPEDAGMRAAVTPLQERMAGEARRGLVLMMAAVGAVLLILWVNLANLSLVRATGRAREAAIRAALGAGRARLARQSLAESLALALAGGALGTGLARWGVRALVAAAPLDLPRLSQVRVDPAVLLFALAVSLAAGAVLGILPALGSTAAHPYEMLKSAGRASTEGRGRLRLRNLLVSVEVGLSTALLVTAGLLTASFVRVMRVDKGFDVERVLALDLSLPSTRYPEGGQRAALFKRVLEAAAPLPGVERVSLVSALPLEGETWVDLVGVEHDKRPLIERPSANVRFVSPGYFTTLRMPLAGGRDFGESDRDRRVTIISSSLGQRLWPGLDALGRKIENGRDAPYEVIGVTPDVHSTSLEREPVNMMYRPYWDNTQRVVSLLVRTAMDPRGMAPVLRRMVWSVDSEVPVPEVRTLREVMLQSVAQRRFQMLLVVLFAAAALALAAFGTYGVVSYAVARRRAEMGIRMALGAGKGRLLAMVVRQGMMPVAAGLALGMAAALAIGRFVASMLFQVSPREPVSFLAAAAVLLAVAAAACWIPARRAARVDPVNALRME